MPDSWQWGSLLVNGALAANILAGLAAWLGVRWWMRNQQGMRSVLDYLFNGMMIIVLMWKFGWVLFEPWQVWEEPVSLLLISGSIREVITGVATAAIYGIWTVRSKRVPWRQAVDLSVLALLIFVAVRSALVIEYGLESSMPWGIRPPHTELSYHPVHWYRALALGLLLVWIWRKSWPPGWGHYAAKGLLYYGITLLVLSMFTRQPQALFYLTYDQLAGVLLVLVGYVMNERCIIKQEGNAMKG